MLILICFLQCFCSSRFCPSSLGPRPPLWPTSKEGVIAVDWTPTGWRRTASRNPCPGLANRLRPTISLPCSSPLQALDRLEKNSFLLRCVDYYRICFCSILQASFALFKTDYPSSKQRLISLQDNTKICSRNC